MKASQNPWRAFEVAYVTIEMETAFVVGASEGDNLFDSVFVTDANGLPCIPGESLAGVLRHALAGELGPDEDPVCRRAFGYQDRDEGAASRIRISFAQPHGQDDRPVPFRTERLDDPVLAALSAGVGRDHVRIGKHGAVDERGKFDELLVPAGARFTFEICLAEESGCSLADLLAKLADPEVRLGGKTRRGLGRFKVVRARSASFNLTEREALTRLSRLPVALHEAAISKELRTVDLPKPSSRDGYHATITLKPLGTWMVGGGIPTGREPARDRDKPWDRVPLSETRIVWTGDRGRVLSEREAPFLVPGSSVKGALRHRTAFHARRRNKQWFSGSEAEYPMTEEEKLLFGEVRQKESGSPGKVYLSDTYLSPETPLEPLQHVSLDRFTQGPMDHLLYDELSLGACELKLDLFVEVPGGEATELARRAFNEALKDLCEGRLSVGAGRGHGRFRGTIKWTDEKTLVKEEALTC